MSKRNVTQTEREIEREVQKYTQAPGTLKRGKPGIVRDPDLIREIEAEIDEYSNYLLREICGDKKEKPEFIKGKHIRIC